MLGGRINLYELCDTLLLLFPPGERRGRKLLAFRLSALFRLIFGNFYSIIYYIKL